MTSIEALTVLGLAVPSTHCTQISLNVAQGIIQRLAHRRPVAFPVSSTCAYADFVPVSCELMLQNEESGNLEAQTQTYTQPSTAHRVSHLFELTTPGEKLNGDPPLMVYSTSY
jgi:hypothetical protein